MLFRPVYLNTRPKQCPPPPLPPPKQPTPPSPEKSRSPSPVRPLIKYVSPEVEVPPAPTPPPEVTHRLPILITGYKFQKVIPPEASRDVLMGRVPYIYFDEGGMQVFTPKHVFNALKLKKGERKKYVDYACVGGHEREFPLRHPPSTGNGNNDDEEEEEGEKTWRDSYPIAECVYRLYPFIY